MNVSDINTIAKNEPVIDNHTADADLKNNEFLSREDADLEETEDNANNASDLSSDDDDDDAVPGRRRKHGSDEEEDNWSTTDGSDESVYSDAESGNLSDDKDHFPKMRHIDKERSASLDSSSHINENIENSLDEKGVEEENKVNRKDPAFVPRGRFYMHDDRLGTDEEDDKVNVDTHKEKVSQARADRTQRWSNDRFDKLAQAPKSENELISAYGYNIRSHGADDATSPDLGNRGNGRRKSASKRRPNVGDFISEKSGVGEIMTKHSKKPPLRGKQKNQPKLRSADDPNCSASSKNVNATFDHIEDDFNKSQSNDDKHTASTEEHVDFGCGPPLPSTKREQGENFQGETDDFEESHNAQFHGRPGFGSRRRPRRARHGSFVEDESRGRKGRSIRGGRGAGDNFVPTRGSFIGRVKNKFNNDDDDNGVDYDDGDNNLLEDNANVKNRGASHETHRRVRGGRTLESDHSLHSEQGPSSRHQPGDLAFSGQVDSRQNANQPMSDRGFGGKFRNARNHGPRTRDENSCCEAKEVPATRTRYSEQRSKVPRAAEWADDNNSALEFIPRNFEEFAADAERAAAERIDSHDNDDECDDSAPIPRRRYRAGRQRIDEYEENAEFDVQRGRGQPSRGYRRGRPQQAYNFQSTHRLVEEEDAEISHSYRRQGVSGAFDKYRDNFRARGVNRGRGRRPDLIGREFYRRRGSRADQEHDNGGGYVGSGADVAQKIISQQKGSGASTLGNSAAHSLEKFEPPPRFQDQLYLQKDSHDQEIERITDSVAQLRRSSGTGKRGYTHQRPPLGVPAANVVSLDTLPINSVGASGSPPRFRRMAEQNASYLPINTSPYISTVSNVTSVYATQQQNQPQPFQPIALAVAQFHPPQPPFIAASNLGVVTGGPVYYSAHQQAPINAAVNLSPPKRPIPIVDPSNSSSNSVKDN